MKFVPPTRVKKALVTWGGWDGHTPRESAELFAEILRQEGYAVDLVDTLAVYEDDDYMEGLDLVVPVWTQSSISKEQETGLCNAVMDGCGLAGWHGCMCDSFHDSMRYQYMTGGQWVAHPGGIVDFEVNITKPDDPIVAGLADFKLRSEQYYMHMDPGVEVLATTTFSGQYEMQDWIAGVVMPVVWKKRWGDGKVFYASFGHTVQDFDVPAAREIVRRGLLWATRSDD